MSDFSEKVCISLMSLLCVILDLSRTGTPNPPTELSFVIKNNCLTINWSPPFILAGTEVKFKVVASIPGHSSSLLTQHLSHTFSYHILNISRCFLAHQFNFSVHSINRVGESEPAIILVLIPQDTSLCGEYKPSGGGNLLAIRMHTVASNSLN